jgi:hypothetical protein
MKYYSLILVSLIFLKVNGQTLPGCWMWSGGVQQTNNYAGSYGTKGVASPNNYPPGLYEASEWQDQLGNFWLYGGVNQVVGFYDNMWKYNLFTQQWTWVSGTGLADQNPAYGIKGVPSVTNSPGFRSTSYSWVDNFGKFWLFGGIASYTALGGGVAYGDLWKYDPTNNTWAWMKGPQYYGSPGVYGTKGVEDSLNYPPSQMEMGVSWTDDVNGNLWLVAANGCLWRYNISTNNWTWMKGDTSQIYPNPVYGTKGVPALANTPGSTFFDYTRWKDSKGDFWYLYSRGSAGLKVLWRYQIPNNCWTWMWGDTTFTDFHNYGDYKCDSTENELDPRTRMEGRACWIDGCDNLWVMGGASVTQTANPTLNDLMFYSTNTNQWTWVAGDTVQTNTSSFGILNVASPANYPSSRSGAHPFKSLNGDLGLFGGLGSSYSSLADMWIFTPDSTCTGCGDKLLPVSMKTSPPKNSGSNPYLYPNPSTGNFEIRNTSGFTEVAIYKVTGELVYRKQIHVPVMNIDIDVSGVFTVQLTSTKSAKTLKLVVTK